MSDDHKLIRKIREEAFERLGKQGISREDIKEVRRDLNPPIKNAQRQTHSGPRSEDEAALIAKMDEFGKGSAKQLFQELAAMDIVQEVLAASGKRVEDLGLSVMMDTVTRIAPAYRSAINNATSSPPLYNAQFQSAREKVHSAQAQARHAYDLITKAGGDERGQDTIGQSMRRLKQLEEALQKISNSMDKPDLPAQKPAKGRPSR